MKRSKDKKIVVGLSGGVDSSMALVILKQKGWTPVGVSLKLPVWKDKKNLIRENICCTRESVEKAEKLCRKMGAPHFVVDTRKDFRKDVIRYFTREFRAGRTPNPCIICNRFHKIRHLIGFADKKGIECVATGHYAKKRFNEETERYELVRAEDKEKDQTYYLSYLTQRQLSRTVFPLGEYVKKEIQRSASKKGLENLISKKESQNFCFVAEKSLSSFLKQKIGQKKGEIVDQKNKKLGTHDGVWFFTIGQRKGLGLPGGPYYVQKLEPENNRVVVTKNRKEVAGKKIEVGDLSWIAGRAPELPLKAEAKIRYRHRAATASVSKGEKGVRVVFETPQFAPAPGQFCVFYKKEVCLGGGPINSVLD